MEQIRQKGGVPAVVIGLGIFIILYSLWGANLLRQQQQANSQDPSNSVAANL